MTLKNNRAPLLSNIKLYAPFHHHMRIQTGVTVRKRLSWVVTSVTLTFDLWPWPFAWTLLWSLVITPENIMMIRWWEHSQKGVTDGRTDGQTDRRTENTICRAAWSQLKRDVPYVGFHQGNIRFPLWSSRRWIFFYNVLFTTEWIPTRIPSLWLLYSALGDIHYSDVVMSAMASQITSVSIVCSTVCSDANQRKHQSSASLAFVREIHRAMDSHHKEPVTLKMFQFDDVIMIPISAFYHGCNFIILGTTNVPHITGFQCVQYLVNDKHRNN